MRTVEHTMASSSLPLGALELGAVTPVADAALERAALALMGPTKDPWRCHYIDDSALEGMSMQPPQPQTRKWYPGYPGCV